MNKTKYEIFALDQIFTTWPQALTYAEICALCLDDEQREAYNTALEDTSNGDEQLELCERYETEWWDNIPFLLDELKNAAFYHFGEEK